MYCLVGNTVLAVYSCLTVLTDLMKSFTVMTTVYHCDGRTYLLSVAIGWVANYSFTLRATWHMQ